MSLANRKSLEPYLYDTVEYYEHQIEGIRRMARMQNFLLADDMGLGKSLQALTVAAIDVVRGWCDKILVVAPVSLKGNWSDEIEKFTRFPYIVLGQEEIRENGHYVKMRKLGPVDRAKQLEAFEKLKGPKVLIVNYEQVQPHFKDFNRLGFDIIIFDEAHYLKNYKSQRTKACLKLTSTRKFLLTGTPMLNQVNELWPLLHIIDPAGYPRYWPFVTRYCVFGGFKDKQIIGVKNEKELTERLQAVMIRRMKKDVLDLPDVQYIDRNVDLLPEQRKIYDKLISDLILENISTGTVDEIENALTKFLRLKQICGTTLPFTGQDFSAKLDLAVSDAIELLLFDKKLVVFTQFRDVQEAFCQRMDSIAPDFDIWELNGDVPTEERQGVVRAWSTHPRPAMLVCMLQVAGVGLNMTAARNGFFIDELFVPGLNQQAVDRMHRIGADTTQPVQINRYRCRNTIESRVVQILNTKKKLFGSIVDQTDFKRKLMQALMEKDA